MEIQLSIIIPINNGAKWIDTCFESILNQNCLRSGFRFEVCVCNDGSSDNTLELLTKWYTILKNYGMKMEIASNVSSEGVGSAKNKAVSLSTGTYLCFQDVDDIMLPSRILLQYTKAISLPANTIVGSKFIRDPIDSTLRYSKWANELTHEQLEIQIYTSNGPTIVMPTWFCHRDVFKSVGGFSENGKGTSEDLIFFYKHLDLGGHIARVDECLLIYKYHPSAATFSINEQTIWNLRFERLENQILSKWEQFTIWNAGKQGKKFYRSLSQENKRKVKAFCDVDIAKINKRNYVYYNEATHRTDDPIKIVHFKNASAPFVICVKLNMTEGNFEANLKSLNLKEHTDYVYFS